MQRDVLIVGFGLAGWALTKALQKQGLSFVVFDPLSSCSSSRVATGIYNPVVLKRFRAVWQAKTLMETSLPFYYQYKYKGLHNPMSIFRVFSSVAEQNNWSVAADNPELSHYIGAKTSTLNTHVKSPFGLGEVQHTGWVNTNALLDIEEQKLESGGCFVREKFNYQELSLSQGGVSYKDWNATHVIFAEGIAVKGNPWFSGLPIIPNKGEWLVISCKGLHLDCMVKGSVFIVPLGNDIYRVGATYQREFEHDLPTTEGKQWLISQFKKLVALPFKVLYHGAGFRPTTPDRRPIVGHSPKHNSLWCLNGLGSRGVLWAPYLATLLVSELYGSDKIPDTLHSRRFL